MSLLSKWLFKILNEEGIWQTLLKQKYLGRKTLAQVTKQPGDSEFWSGLMAIKDHFFARGKFQVQDGNQIRFWEDWWVGQASLMQQYPTLYNIVRKKNQSGVDVLIRTRPLNILFRRSSSDR